MHPYIRHISDTPAIAPNRKSSCQKSVLGGPPASLPTAGRLTGSELVHKRERFLRHRGIESSTFVRICKNTRKSLAIGSLFENCQLPRVQMFF